MVAKTISRPWRCIVTNPLAEENVAAILLKNNFEYYLPRYQQIGKKKETTRILFPGYIFVKFNIMLDPWQRLISQPGVKKIFGQETGSPIRIDAALIESLQKFTYSFDAMTGIWEIKEKRTGPIKRFRRTLIEPGRLLEVTDGPYAGFQGICESLSKLGIQMPITIFARTTIVTISRSDVKIASPTPPVHQSAEA